jgi:Predicted membrane protein (DUF2306)
VSRVQTLPRRPTPWTWSAPHCSIWFLICLVLAFRALRAGDMVLHRRWMIRAFAIGIAVGTIRIWTALARRRRRKENGAAVSKPDSKER